MIYEAKDLVETLRFRAEWCRRVKIVNAIIVDGEIMEHAADVIEGLLLKLESDERKYSRDAFETLVAEGLKVEALRDAWKCRAERELEALRPCYCCKHYRKELAESGRECDPVCNEKCDRASEWEWRGPCVENGGGLH